MGRKALLGALGFLVLAGGLLFALQTFGTHTTTPGNIVTNVLGWLWGGSTDQSLPNPPPPLPPVPFNSPLRATGLGWINLHCDPNDPNGPTPGCSNTSISYGLKIPPANGNVEGYAWASNVGWLNFQPSGPYPTNCGANPCPTTGVQRAGNQLKGWARFESIRDAWHTCINTAPTPPHTCSTTLTNTSGVSAEHNSGGWEGWVKFGTGPFYTGSIGGTQYNGVQIVDQPGPAEDIRGFAWSNEFGWIQWGGLTAPPGPNIENPNPTVVFSPGAITCTLNADPPSGTAPLQGELSWSITNFTAGTLCNLSGGPIQQAPASIEQTGIAQYGVIEQPGLYTYILACTSGSGSSASSGQCPASVTVSESLPVVTVQATDATASEAGANTGTFKIERTGSVGSALVVQFTMSGSAGSGDYTLSDPSPVTILPGAASADIILTPIDDSVQEPTETAVLTLAPSASYSVGAPPSNDASISILDDDGPEADIRANGLGGTVPLPTGVTEATLTWCGAGATPCANASGGCTVYEGSIGGTVLSTANPGTLPVTIPAGASRTYHLQCLGVGNSSATDMVTVNAGGSQTVTLSAVNCSPSQQNAPPNVTVFFTATGGNPTGNCLAGFTCTPVYQWSAPGGSPSCAGASYNAQTNTGTPAQCFLQNFNTEYPPPPAGTSIQSHTVTVTNKRPELQPPFNPVNPQADTCAVTTTIEVPP